MEATEANEERIEEMHVDVKTDEFQNYFNMEYEPKVLITFKDNPLKVIFRFKIFVGIINNLTGLYSVCDLIGLLCSHLVYFHETARSKWVLSLTFPPI